ncbi:MAG TPA: cation:proton antiporter [Gemmatimonadaceae bacterium]|jgi:Kef-type K+ transport system membrane component KefB|nr:cation:proton antiporter [Gemmatimonadaceae bacterium]
MTGAGVFPLLAASADGHGFSGLLVVLVAVIVATKVLGELAQRIGQPAVLGELIAGILLGASVLGVLDPTDSVMYALSELGIIILLFEIGLHTDVRSLVSVGRSAVTVGMVGLLVPLALGYAALSYMGIPMLGALVAAAALTATSIGISARVLSELGQLDTDEGRVVLGAAVLDDVLGLVVLSVVAGVVGGATVTPFTVVQKTAIAIGFVLVAVALGSRAIPPLFRAVERVRTSGTIGLAALAFAFALAWIAEQSGSAMIIGAFAAGIVLHGTPQRKEIEKATTHLGFFFVPIFFAVVGASVDLAALATPRALTVGGVLIAIGVAGKVLAGYAPVWFKGSKLLVGVAMIPRGEVGLIFAQLGLASGALDAELFGAVMLMVLVTTLMTPPVLGLVARRRDEGERDEPGEGGIDDLVAGVSTSRPAARRSVSSH